MVHPATLRTVKSAISTLNVPLDVGFVFPPKPGEPRGYGQWTNRNLDLAEIVALLPRAAAANSRGGNIFMRLGIFARDAHPGIVMLDDLTATATEQLSLGGFEPCLTVETSPGNYQAWVKLISAGTVSYSVMTDVARHLAHTYGADDRATSPRQPGRLVGFTNRKPKHQTDDGKFPFVKLTEASPGRVAKNGADLIHRVSGFVTGRAARAALPETPRDAAVSLTRPTQEIVDQLVAIDLAQKNRISREVAEGRRLPDAASNSEIDFAVAKAALAAGIEVRHITSWLKTTRVHKDQTYPERTVDAASSWRFKLR